MVSHEPPAPRRRRRLFFPRALDVPRPPAARCVAAAECSIGRVGGKAVATPPRRRPRRPATPPRAAFKISFLNDTEGRCSCCRDGRRRRRRAATVDVFLFFRRTTILNFCVSYTLIGVYSVLRTSCLTSRSRPLTLVWLVRPRITHLPELKIFTHSGLNFVNRNAGNISGSNMNESPLC